MCTQHPKINRGSQLSFTLGKAPHFRVLMPVVNKQYRTRITRHTRTIQGYVEDLGNGVPLNMVLIPKGHFTMGSPAGELEHTDDEGTQHEVYFPEDFFMGMYPVTQSQWKAVACLPPVDPKIKLDPDCSRFTGDDLPVERVNWYEAKEFCDRLSVLTKRNYDLPTEAEWEYACRAGTTTAFYFGETITPDIANYDGNTTYGNGPKGEYREQTTPVGSLKSANSWGLHDMHGNVWEWCLDHWHDSYVDKPEELKQDGNAAWLSSDESKNRLLRGGSWGLNAKDCRSAVRLLITPDNRYVSVGFRVVCRASRTL